MGLKGEWHPQKLPCIAAKRRPEAVSLLSREIAGHDVDIRSPLQCLSTARILQDSKTRRHIQMYPSFVPQSPPHPLLHARSARLAVL